MIFLHKNNIPLSLLLFFLLLHKSHAQQWEIKKDKNGIKVYTRQFDSSKIKEYKAVALIKTSLEKAVKVITDGNNLWKWNYKTSSSKTIKLLSENEFVFWMENDLPWPVKNRDIISRIKVAYQENGTAVIDISPETTHVFPSEGNIIRIKNFKGYWQLVPRGDYVEITQQLYGDPEGKLPNWLINSVIITAPYHTFLNLKEILEN